MKAVYKGTEIEGLPSEIKVFLDFDIDKPKINIGSRNSAIISQRQSKKYHSWSSEDLTALWALRTKGVKVPSIARQLGRSRSSISNAISKIKVGIYKIRG